MAPRLLILLHGWAPRRVEQPLLLRWLQVPESLVLPDVECLLA
jgi:hypothetical protein